MKKLLLLFIIVEIVSILSVSAAREVNLEAPAVSEELVNYINSLKTTWTAKVPERFDGMQLKHMAKSSHSDLCGTLPTKENEKFTMKVYSENMKVDLPDNFDPREQWGDMCPSLKVVRDQASCGSCWAFGGVESMTDRFCINKNGSAGNPPISAEEVVGCCNLLHAPLECYGSMGCNGGQVGEPWSYWHKKGIVTGGLYGDDKYCSPYTIPPCEHHVVGPLPNCSEPGPGTPSCPKKCVNGAEFSKDKHYGDSPYGISSKDMQQELYQHGPIEGSFAVYEDFPSYKSGVYQHTTGGELGLHAIKIMGWGVENGTPYWLVANSWNEGWGDGGYFKILRGHDECGIEGNCVAALPK